MNDWAEAEHTPANSHVWAAFAREAVVRKDIAETDFEELEFFYSK